MFYFVGGFFGLVLNFFPFQLHPLCQQTEIVKYCNKNNIVVQAYCPIIRGRMDNPVITALATKVRVLNID